MDKQDRLIIGVMFFVMYLWIIALTGMCIQAISTMDELRRDIQLLQLSVGKEAK